MNLSAGYPYNLIRTGIPYDYPQLRKNIKTDIAIMGGGISGSLMAFHLMKAGIDCVVVDGRTIGLGSSCASTSLLQYEIDEPLSKLADKIGDKNATRAYVFCAEAIDQLKDISDKIGFTDFQYCSSVYFAAHKKDISFLTKEFDARMRAGFDVEYIEQEQLQKKFGLSSPAAICSAKGAQTNAYTMTHALHQYSIKKGVDVYDRTPVEKIVHTKRGVTLTTSDGYTIRCKKLVYATGYEAVQYVKPSIVKLSATFATVSEQFNKEDLFAPEHIFWNTADPYLYMRGTSDKRIVVGGRDDDYTSSRTMDHMIKAKSKKLENDFRKCFADVDFRKEFSWSGVFGSTKDGLPYIGPYAPLPNALFALGFGGNGITFSVIAARLLTALLKNGKVGDLNLFRFERI